MRRKYILHIGLLFTLIFGIIDSAIAEQEERILNYHSDIFIQSDGSMLVTETIRVIAMGDNIKRGIYRTFPTTYHDQYGNRIKVGFNVTDVLRDGRQEAYHIERESNGVKIYIGQQDVFLKSGEYTYTLSYQTTRQLGYFDDFDELYWNVTGTDWDFIIDEASATVTLPTDATVMNVAGYTGYQDDKGQNYTVDQSSTQVTFTTTEPLQPRQGLTIAVSWPKGFVPVPTTRDRVEFIIKDNPSAGAGLIGVLVLLIYYLAVWMQVGKDPEKAMIIPLFKPPYNISPAAARYIMKMGYSNRVYAAAIVNMAVKGFLKINETKGEFSLTRTGAEMSALSSGEKRIAKSLFVGNNSIVLRQRNHTKIGKSISSLKKYLKLEIEKLYFARNSVYLIPGIVISIIALIAMVIQAPVVAGAIFMTVWLSGWSVGVTALTYSVFNAWRAALGSKGSHKVVGVGGAIGMTAFAIPFIGGEIFGLWAFSTMLSLPGAAVFMLLIAVNILFYQLLKAPTLHGRRIMDQLEGFKMYMEFAEESRLNFLHPPERTPELFEKYLPYAIALGVENAWSDKFAGVLEKATEQDAYSPTWYTGRSFHTEGWGSFASSLGSSFSSAIASSSTTPGSSSGSGGGGSSGGGGGGGGGGGW
ncbi:DUF2207 domain-containing protein [candidate division KSB1 bacterium]|nr:DUF2207 domain-containing protein [candidate division KSB1 bacterium]